MSGLSSTYEAVCQSGFATVARSTKVARRMNEPLRKTSLYERHVKAGARIVPFTGFEMPVQYTGIVDEHQAVRTACGIFDVSHMGELEMRGEYAAQVVDYLITNDASKLVDGQAL